jgi:ankyrin repeat protein
MTEHKSRSAQKKLSVFLEVCGSRVHERGSKTGLSALTAAILTYNFAIARKLLHMKARIPPPDIVCALIGDVYPFYEIAGAKELSRADEIEVMEMLKEMSAMTDDKTYLGHAVPFAAGVGDLESVNHLVSMGADVNADSWTYMGSALSITALCNFEDKALCYSIAKCLLYCGADVNCHPTAFGNGTALQLAASRDGELVRLLLERGADVNAPALEIRGGVTPLQEAAGSHQGSMIIVKLLLEWGADVNSPPAREEGITALQEAAIQGNTNIAHLLLERGADVNALGAEISGRTALEGAAERGCLDMVQLLLNAGAEPSESAASFAYEEGHFVIVDIIRDEMKRRKVM